MGLAFVGLAFLRWHFAALSLALHTISLTPVKVGSEFEKKVSIGQEKARIELCPLS